MSPASTLFQAGDCPALRISRASLRKLLYASEASSTFPIIMFSISYSTSIARFTNPSWCCKYLGSVFCEKHRELQTPVLIGPHFPLNGDFWSVFGPFRGPWNLVFPVLLSFRQNETVRDGHSCFGWAKYQVSNFCAANPSYHLGPCATLTGGLQV
jgi:hypothetical protein